MKEPLNDTVLTQKVLRILALISVLVSLSACGNTTSSTNPTPQSSEPKTTSSPTTPDSTADSKPAEVKPTQTAQVYWLKDLGTRFEPVPVPMSVKADANNPNSVLKAGFEQLLSSSKSNDPQLVSAIPPGTQLRSITLKSDGIYVDLSSEFAKGGGSAGIIGRLAQVLYTATSLDPNAAVWIQVEGQPLTAIEGEGLEVPQPMTRQNFQEQFEL